MQPTLTPSYQSSFSWPLLLYYSTAQQGLPLRQSGRKKKGRWKIRGCPHTLQTTRAPFPSFSCLKNEFSLGILASWDLPQWHSASPQLKEIEKKRKICSLLPMFSGIQGSFSWFSGQKIAFLPKCLLPFSSTTRTSLGQSQQIKGGKISEIHCLCGHFFDPLQVLLLLFSSQKPWVIGFCGLFRVFCCNQWESSAGMGLPNPGWHWKFHL